MPGDLAFSDIGKCVKTGKVYIGHVEMSVGYGITIGIGAWPPTPAAYAVAIGRP